MTAVKTFIFRWTHPDTVQTQKSNITNTCDENEEDEDEGNTTISEPPAKRRKLEAGNEELKMPAEETQGTDTKETTKETTTLAAIETPKKKGVHSSCDVCHKTMSCEKDNSLHFTSKHHMFRVRLEADWKAALAEEEKRLQENK